MRQDEVVVGETYRMEVSGRLARVRVGMATVSRGRKKWYGHNLDTGHQVGPFTAARLRGRVDAQGHLVTGQVHQERTPGEEQTVDEFLDDHTVEVTRIEVGQAKWGETGRTK